MYNINDLLPVRQVACYFLIVFFVESRSKDHPLIFEINSTLVITLSHIMKKNLLTTVFTLASFILFAQKKIIIKAGANLASMESTGQTVDAGIVPRSIASFNFGGMTEVRLNSKYYLQPGLFFTNKGYKVDYSANQNDYSVSLKSKVSVSYIEIPLNIIGKFDAAPGHFLLGAGPYVAYALSAKNKGHFQVDGPGTSEDISQPTDGKIDFGDGEDEMKRVDYGVNMLAGYEFLNGRFFSLGYGLGLNDLSNVEGETAKHRVINLSIGFTLR